ncbi:lytic transglycosylase domain-containing protein [Streptomyces sp. NBC_01317]|uniref:lytic transglycosylase domain-containing protein n=1 Tax=Streptomyces sp. NBC_01317 TaxID=2903822 RepID=UPI002E160AB0|nr:lytic transglycosylase domain-containing protein [Streptomyces sp. NBC_01317]
MAVPFGSRLRRGATTTAVAAVAIAALSASQAPGAVLGLPGGGTQAADATTTPPGTPATGNSPYYTDLPPLNPPDKPLVSIDLPAATGDVEAGIPATVLDAYKKAEQALAETRPDCRLPWQLLAAIGKVESGQARGGAVDADGTTTAPILGPVLNGVGFANISDTDNGAYDGDTTHDRAVGPMQFIPSTWATSGQDGNGDGRKDPNNIYDAALAAGHYLCAAGRDLTVDADLDEAILSYNHSQDYLNTVRSWLEYYRKGTHEVPNGTGVLPSTDTPTGTVPTTPVTPSAPGTPPPTSPGTPPPTKPPTTPPTSPPTTPPTKPPTTPPTKPPASKPPVVSHVEKAGTGTFTTVAGSLFPGRAAVRAEDKTGKPVAKVEITFTIAGDTDARFVPDATTVTVVTGTDGMAIAPQLKAGEKAGTFVVRATPSSGLVPGVTWTTTVTARPADALARTDSKDLTAVAGAAFADPVQIKATSKGTAVPGAGVTASVISSADDPTAPAGGPYFKAADGGKLRTLTGLTTGADGVLQLPDLFADTDAGTFVLRLRTEDGVTLDITVKVTAPPTTPPPTEPGTPSGEPSGTPSSSPSTPAG